MEAKCGGAGVLSARPRPRPSWVARVGTGGKRESGDLIDDRTVLRHTKSAAEGRA